MGTDNSAIRSAAARAASDSLAPSSNRSKPKETKDGNNADVEITEAEVVGNAPVRQVAGSESSRLRAATDNIVPNRYSSFMPIIPTNPNPYGQFAGAGTPGAAWPSFAAPAPQQARSTPSSSGCQPKGGGGGCGPGGCTPQGGGSGGGGGSGRIEKPPGDKPADKKDEKETTKEADPTPKKEAERPAPVEKPEAEASKE